eukprot:TRINITY_DN5625_c0_g1_i3.p1 TRINITY_DN5625_c0_g1~~TRINITY_DN5625_c0_g1_i3.p1  ORF type:complete len:724 (+),score=172.16 TRINITY_DN5625_c0_g1_i3:320-2173(+)
MEKLTNPRNMSDTEPCFLGDDDATVLFVRGQQLWRIPTARCCEPQQCSDMPLPISNVRVFAGAACGATLVAFSAEVFPGMSMSESKKKLDERTASKATGVLYEKLFVRHWNEYCDGRRNHVFVAALPPTGELLREEDVVDVMAVMDSDCPVKPFGDAGDFTFTPAGDGIVFAAKNATGSEEAWSTRHSLYLASPLFSDAPPCVRCLTEHHPAWCSSPVFSPDGQTLLYKNMKRAGYEADRWSLILRCWATGAEREVCADWDFSADLTAWSADGCKLFITADCAGAHPLFVADVATGTVTRLTEKGNVSFFKIVDSSRILVIQDTLKAPADAFLMKTDGSNVTRLTNFNEELMRCCAVGDYEQFSFAGWNGERVSGYCQKPALFDPSRRYPVALVIHGGPQSSMGDHWHWRWSSAAFSGAGFGVVFVDFHGSTGYGQRFTDSIRDDYGGKPLVDLQKGLAAALETYPWLDASRVCALGASYGGYMIDWIAGAWPEPFRCLVSHAGIFDDRAFYYTTEELWFPEWDHNAKAFENKEAYERFNPSSLVHNWRVPMLITQGGQDFRIVDTASLSAFNVLQRRGVPSQLLYFQNEGHWIKALANSKQWYTVVLQWMTKWTSN